MSPPRNQIVKTLASRLSEKLQGNGLTTVRRGGTAMPNAEEMPALIVGVATDQVNEEDAAVNPGKWMMQVGCFLWVKDGSAEGPTPTMLELMGSVEDALKLDVGESGGWWTTLGGTVWHAALVGADTIPDVGEDVGLAALRIEVACKPVR